MKLNKKQTFEDGAILGFLLSVTDNLENISWLQKKQKIFFRLVN